MKNIRISVLVLLTAFLFIGLCFAQTNDVVGTNTVGTVADGGGGATLTPATSTWETILLIAIPLVTPMLVRLLALLIPKIPTWFLPVLAPLLVVLANFISELLNGPSVSPLMAVLLGAAGVCVREVKDQVQQKAVEIKAARATALLLIPFLLIGFTGCTTTQVDPVTGLPVKTYDPVKTQQVKDAVQPVLSSAVRRVLENNPTKKAEIAEYFKAVAAPFCVIGTTGVVDLTLLQASLESITAKYQGKVDPLAIDVKNSALSLFKVYYGDRFKAELPPDAWTRNIADLVCVSVDQGLKDAGLPGVK